MRKVCLTILCITAMLYGCGAPESEFKAVATTQDVMAGVIDPVAFDIWNAVATTVDEQGVHEIRPQTKEEWQKLAFSARGLAESSSLLLYEGRKEDDGDWVTFTNEMSAKALEAAKAAEDQNPDEIIRIGGEIYEACTKCHEGYLDKVMERRTGGAPEEAPAPSAPAAPAAPGK